MTANVSIVLDPNTSFEEKVRALGKVTSDVTFVGFGLWGIAKTAGFGAGTKLLPKEGSKPKDFSNVDDMVNSLDDVGNGVKGAGKITVKYGDEAVSVYRGGNNFTIKQGEIKIDNATGLVKNTHGISLDVNPNTVSKFGGAYKIDSLPDGLQIIQRGIRAEHFEIILTKPMTVDEFQGLLNQIKTSPFK